MPSHSRNRKALATLGALCIAAILLSLRAMPQQVTTTAPLTYSTIATASSAPAGFASIVFPAQQVTVSTTAVTANSQIFVQFDETAGSSCTTGVGALEGNRYFVLSRTAGTSFVIKAAAAIPTGDTACLSYFIVN
jgi:hypothetical protein